MTPPRKRCIAIRHINFEDLGSFVSPLEQAGYEIKYLEAATDDLKVAKNADLTVFLGGPISVYEETAYPFIKDELAIAQYRLEQEKPTLGLCLGSQMIARAAGAKVYPGEKGKEIGWQPITLTHQGYHSVIAPLAQDDAQILHWHGDTFNLPDEATLLGSSDLYTNQIYCIKDHVLAFQCHPELDPKKIEYWLIGHAVEIANTPETDVVTLREATQRYGNHLVKRGFQTINNWLQKLD